MKITTLTHKVTRKCYAFNNFGNCTNYKCQYIHTCLRCQGTHVAITCRHINNVNIFGNHMQSYTVRPLRPSGSDVYFRTQQPPRQELGNQAPRRFMEHLKYSSFHNAVNMAKAYISSAFNLCPI